MPASGQRVYRIFDPGREMFFKKTKYGNGTWVREESQATVWNGLGQLKNSFRQGQLQGKNPLTYNVIQYTVLYVEPCIVPSEEILKKSK